jgi:hypothetical protein
VPKGEDAQGPILEQIDWQATTHRPIPPARYGRRSIVTYGQLHDGTRDFADLELTSSDCRDSYPSHEQVGQAEADGLEQGPAPGRRSRITAHERR